MPGNEKEFLYLFGRHGFDRVKIGRTSREVETRIRELRRPTGVPPDFECIAQWEVRDSMAAEREAHSRLEQYRQDPYKEWFSVSISQARNVLNDVARGYSSHIAGHESHENAAVRYLGSDPFGDLATDGEPQMVGGEHGVEFWSCRGFRFEVDAKLRKNEAELRVREYAHVLELEEAERMAPFLRQKEAREKAEALARQEQEVARQRQDTVRRQALRQAECAAADEYARQADRQQRTRRQQEESSRQAWLVRTPEYFGKCVAKRDVAGLRISALMFDDFRLDISYCAIDSWKSSTWCKLHPKSGWLDPLVWFCGSTRATSLVRLLLAIVLPVVATVTLGLVLSSWLIPLAIAIPLGLFAFSDEDRLGYAHVMIPFGAVGVFWYRGWPGFGVLATSLSWSLIGMLLIAATYGVFARRALANSCFGEAAELARQFDETILAIEQLEDEAGSEINRLANSPMRVGGYLVLWLAWQEILGALVRVGGRANERDPSLSLQDTATSAYARLIETMAHGGSGESPTFLLLTERIAAIAAKAQGIGRGRVVLPKSG